MRTKGAKTKHRRGASPARRFSVTERERLKLDVQRLDLHGYGPTAIAKQLNVSPATVCNLVAEVNKDYHDAYVDDRKRWAAKATAAHLDVIRVAQEELTKLRERGRRTTMREEGTTPGEKGGPYDKKRVTRENPEVGGLLTVIQNGWKEIAAIHGIKELPAQVFNLQINQNTTTIFDQLLAAMLRGDPPTDLPAIANGPVIDATPTVSTP